MTKDYTAGRATFGSAPSTASPYQRAAQVWDERLGSQAAQARAWRWAALTALGLLALSTTGLALQAREAKVRAFVVPVDALGRPGRIVAEDGVYRPSQAEVGYFLAQWVTSIRARPLDPVVLRDNWSRAFAMSAGEALARLSALARASDPLKEVGEAAVDVEIASVLPRSRDTYQVQWRETRFERARRPAVSRWTALVTADVTTPRDEAELRANPLGLRVTGFQLSREL